MPPKPDLVFNNAPNDVETDHPAFNVKLSPTKPDQDLSHTLRPSAPIIKDRVSDSEDESETKTPQIVLSFVQPIEQTAIPKPISDGKRKNQKAGFVCKSLDHLIKDCDYHDKKMAQPTARNHAHKGYHKQYAQMTLLNLQKHMVPAIVLTQSKLVPINAVRPVSTVVPKISVTRPRQAKIVVIMTNSPPKRHINRSPSTKASNFPSRVTAVKALMVNVVKGNPQHALKDTRVIDCGCSSIGFMRPFGCPVTILNTLDSLGKFDGMVDEGFLVGYFVNSKAFRVFNSKTRIVQETLHLNFLENKPNVAGSGPSWLCDIDTFTKTMNYQLVTAGNQSNPSVDAAFDEKEPEFDEKKHKSEVNVSPSSKFKDFSDNSINEVNAAGTQVPAVGQISPNSTNTFSAAGPLNVVASPTHRNSSCIDISQYPDDPDMPELEDITYSDDEDDVGVEADFNNLETSITVSLIPTTRFHKDHYVTQIISDLSSATQTRSMTRVAKDQGGLSHINNDDFHTCMFVCFLSQEEPKRIHQALKDPSWIEAMQEELRQFKMQKVWVLVDLPYGKRAIGTKWVFGNK
nr:hypothetical protein [Tanacetum cinerariifolium]